MRGRGGRIFTLVTTSRTEQIESDVMKKEAREISTQGEILSQDLKLVSDLDVGAGTNLGKEINKIRVILFLFFSCVLSSLTMSSDLVRCRDTAWLEK